MHYRKKNSLVQEAIILKMPLAHLICEQLLQYCVILNIYH